MDIVDAIDKRIGEVRTESLDLSVGEITSLHEAAELVIQPDFQRLFRWSPEQRSRLIESMLLELPIPSIFVIERESGVFELIDGLQRVSSLIQFLNHRALNLDKLTLQGCDLIPELNGQSFDDLPMTLKLRLKRTGIRTVVIKRQSSQFLRYEMFKRLNTGGAKLSEQDIRNVNARMLGDSGVAFYEFLKRCAAHGPYTTTVELLPSTAMDTRTNEELVLRFFATKNYRTNFKGNVSDWLDDFMDSVLLSKNEFDLAAEFEVFDRLFSQLSRLFGPYAFVKYRNGSPMGGVAPAYYEAVTGGCLEQLNKIEGLSPESAQIILARVVESEAFREVTGPGANSLPKMVRRIELVSAAFA
ncbi:DUF262 domain-containing protein [Uliginosibacterium sediminicola]|uniref:DUF262 domain-containing protein n=1 Tax=Uliginosibacterium sediminicola TaxID=2024550 RepID=A0ABU9Z3V5_9RHOO